jgi:tetratricopeptide (TPR) repeat protein
VVAVSLRLFNEGVRHSLEAQRHRQSGRTEHAEQSDREAVAAFDQVLKLDPRHAGALSGKALTLATLGETREAATLFQKAIEIEPGFAENHRQLGLCLLELGDVPSARKVTFHALGLETKEGYRGAAAAEIYNIGVYVMQRAAQYRDAGCHNDEIRCCLQAQAIFSLALEVDGTLQPAVEALRALSVSLGIEDHGREASDYGKSAKEDSIGRRLWKRLLGRK